MHTYETIFVTTPILTDDEERATVDGMLQIVTDGGGKVFANDRMGRRRLAYPIEKHNDGIYIRFLYDSDVEIPKELERKLRISDRILRSLTVRMEPGWAAASKEQVIKDEQERREAAEREKAAKAEAERLAALAPPPEPPPAAEAETAPAAASDAEPEKMTDAPAEQVKSETKEEVSE